MIEFRTISKHYGPQDVLRDASFHIADGERVGIVGPNGAGKSTVFALLCGEISPDKGTVDVPKQSRIAHLRQEFQPEEKDTALLDYAESGRMDVRDILHRIRRLENAIHQVDGAERDHHLAELGELQSAFEHLGGYTLKAGAESALCGLGFDPQALSNPLSTFSGGWQMRAELARVLVSDPDILLLDEPTNYLDIPAIEWLQKYLREFAGTLALISHDRYLLNSLTSVTIEIANAQATRYAGNYDRYETERELRREHRLAAFRNQERKREQAQRFIDRFRAKNTKASLVQSKIKMLERMEEIAVPLRVLSPGRIRLREPTRSGQEVARLETVGVTYDRERWVLRDIDFSIPRGEKTALVGLNGTGKTTLLRVLAGRLPPSEGKRVLGHKVVVGYQSQEFMETMDPAQTVFETVKRVGKDATEQEVRTLLGGFGFSGDTVEKRVRVLSGGEKVRLAFASLLVNPPNFLVLDEPTTHLDVAAREALEVALKDFRGTVCMVSHDIEFVRHVADSIVAMTPPGIRRYAGGYDYYCERRDVETRGRDSAAEARSATRVSDRKAARRERAEWVRRRARDRRKLKHDVHEAEQRILKLEEEQAELTEVLSGKADTVDFAKVNRRLSEIQKEMDRAVRRWEISASALEAFENSVDDTPKR